jgi:hypothetical protein
VNVVGHDDESVKRVDRTIMIIQDGGHDFTERRAAEGALPMTIIEKSVEACGEMSMILLLSLLVAGRGVPCEPLIPFALPGCEHLYGDGV